MGPWRDRDGSLPSRWGRLKQRLLHVHQPPGLHVFHRLLELCCYPVVVLQDELGDVGTFLGGQGFDWFDDFLRAHRNKTRQKPFYPASVEICYSVGMAPPMNTTALHPIVLEKLRQFSRRRQRLILLRGFCSWVAVWLAAMTALALLDRFVLVEDGARITLSLLAYAATAAVLWQTCVRYLARLPGPRELARLVEAAAPQLRERLLAAIELAESSQQPHWDSDEFRAALQQIVAREVSRLPVESLITRRLIAAWWYAAGAAAVVFLALWQAPGLHFPQAFARAALPAANLPRYSNLHIEVLAPSPASQIVPEGDAVPVTVRVSGGEPWRVILETFPKRGSRERLAMTLSGLHQFSVPLQVHQTPIRYRIRAGDAVTEKFTLQPRPRPQVVRFHKTYRYPAYTRLPARSVVEENGDLDALEGSEVELKLDVDQPVRQAALRLDAGKQPKEIPLQHAPNGQLIARFPLTAAGAYRVQLVAAETGFENKFSPQYEIRVHPDLLPSVKIETPDQDQLVLPPDAVVALSGVAKDDIALARIEQQVQVNRGEWHSFIFPPVSGAVANVTRSWDLFELGAHLGDRVTTKLVAADLKGQRAESLPLRIIISAPGFDPQRHARLQAKQQVDRALQELRAAADSLDQKIQAAKTSLGSHTAQKLQKQQHLLAARAALDDLAEKAVQARQRIHETLPQMAGARDSTDLVLAGVAVSRALREGVEPLQHALERAADHVAAGNDTAARATLHQSQDMISAAVSAPRIAHDAYRQMIAADEARAIGSDLAQLQTDQRALREQLRDPAQTERVARRQHVVAGQLADIERNLKRLSQRTRDWTAQTARDTALDLTRQREQIEKTLAAEPTADKLQPAADAAQQSFENAARQMRRVEQELLQRAETARKQLAERFPNTADSIAQLTRYKSPTPDQFEAVIAQLKDRAALEEKRPQPDAQFAADAARAADALQALAAIAAPTNALRTIEKAFRQLEAAHRLHEQANALRQLAGQERWEKPAPAEAVERARDWKWSHQQIKSLPLAFAQARFPADTSKSLSQIADSPLAQHIADEMRQREQQFAPTQNVAQPLAQIANEIAALKGGLQPLLDAARAEIEKAAPKLSERLAGLAHSAEILKNHTEEQARLAGKPETAERTRAEARNLAHQQQKLDHRVNDARDAIRRDANVQNLATEEGRQRARDADVAAAMLRPPVPNASDWLEYAAQSPHPDKQRDALKNAGELQAKLADTLRTLAEHYKNLEAGSPSATRAALRDAEKEMGLKATLDAEYAKAQALEQLAGLSPLDQLKELEKALQNNQPMRAELSDIARHTLERAAADLQRAADNERSIAQQTPAPSSAAAQQPRIEQTVRDAGNDVARAGRHEHRLGRQDLGREMEQLGQHIENQTGREVAQAAQQMAQAQSPAQVQAAAQAAAHAIQQAADKVNTMLQQPLPAPASPASPESTAGQLAAATGAAAKWLARALDGLDAMMNPSSQATFTAPPSDPTSPPGPSPTTASPQTQPSANQTAAHQAAQSAAQAQASSMISARSQGLTPGQQPMSENEAQGTGAAFTAAGMEVGALPERLRWLRGEWGKLPPKLARDLMESQDDNVSGEYREMVDLYFRAIALKAQEGK